MNHVRHLAAAFALAALLAACSGPRIAAAGPEVRTTAHGDVLADSRGMTLYTFDEDADGKPTCGGLCAVAWPPATAPADASPAGGFTLVTRDDGERQWAHDGMPLYGYYRDSEPGDITGDGVDGTWHVARP